MITKQDTVEIVMLCNEHGIVEEILFPETQVSEYFNVGESILYHVDAESMSRALSFLMQLNTHKFAFNHEANFIKYQQVKTFYFSGFMKDKQFIVIATTHSDSVSELSQELMKINNEQANVFRKLLKESLQEQDHVVQKDIAYFDEISQLNNELLNSQRELARKNQELYRLNAELERVATRDSLTGLYNRRLLVNKFIEEKRRASRLKYTLSLAIIDINHFKKVNDQLGHAAGDDLLVQLAGLIIRLTRESLDIPFRIGGDEFLILFSNCDQSVALTILQRLDIEFKKFTEIASLAYGVIEINKDCDEDLDRCIRVADELMYENKKKNKKIDELRD